MDKELVNGDVSKSFQCPSPSELDLAFFKDQSVSVSALSLEGLSTSFMPPGGIVVEYSEALGSLCQLPNPLNLNLLLSQEETQTPGLNLHEESKSSTPHELLRKPKLASSFDLSYIDFTPLQSSWEVSLIKPETNSPNPSLQSSMLETKYQSAPPSLAEISSLIWSGTPPHANKTDENQRSWREATYGSSQQVSSGYAPVAEDELQRQTSVSAHVENKSKWACDGAPLKC